MLVSFELRDSEVIECFFAQAYMHFSFELLDKTELDRVYGPDGVAIYRLYNRAWA